MQVSKLSKVFNVYKILNFLKIQSWILIIGFKAVRSDLKKMCLTALLENKKNKKQKLIINH